MKFDSLFLALIVLSGSLLVNRCSAQQNPAPDISAERDTPIINDELKAKIIERGGTWSRAIKAKDISLIEGLYDKEAHYLPDNGTALHGVSAISTYWEEIFPFFDDLVLDLKTLEGSRDMLYETGIGNAKVMNEQGQFIDFKFKYVNVWKLQKNGSYKVVIDIFNDLPPLK